jgi:cytochrome c-type biogenesis protein CcmF
LNNVLLAVSAFVVFIGTIWPLISEIAFGRMLSVGPPFFDTSFTPFVIGLAAILPIGAILPWKRAKLGRSSRQTWPALLLAVLLAMFVWTIGSDRSLLAPVGTALGSWLVFGSIADLFARSGKGAIGARLRRITRLPRADFGKAVAHAGFGVTTLGIALLLAWQVEGIRVANVGETFKLGKYDVSLDAVQRITGPNYVGESADLRIEHDGEIVAVLSPEKRFYPIADIPTTEAAIRNGVFSDIYVVLGDKQVDGGWAIRAHIKPFANWIWLGAMLMAFGGVLSLTDRRVRITAGAQKSLTKLAAQT